MKTLFINGSSRTDGNTATLGERLLVGIPHQTINLAAQQLHFDVDQRATQLPQRDLGDDYAQIMGQFAAADDIILGTPVYWYNMSGQLKVFMDRWFDSQTNGFNFAGKRLYLLVVGADDPEHKATPSIATAVQASCDWLKMTFMGTATVIADGPTDVRQLPALPVTAQELRQVLVMTTAK